MPKVLRLAVLAASLALAGAPRGDGILRQEFVLFPHGVNPTDEKSRRAILQRGSPGNGPYTKGIRAFERGEWEKARQRLEGARRLDPALAQVHEALALVYHRLGEYEAGLESADRALELSPWDPDFLRIRYEALKPLDRSEEARRTSPHRRAGSGAHGGLTAMPRGAAP